MRSTASRPARRLMKASEGGPLPICAAEPIRSVGGSVSPWGGRLAWDQSAPWRASRLGQASQPRPRRPGSGSAIRLPRVIRVSLTRIRFDSPAVPRTPAVTGATSRGCHCSRRRSGVERIARGRGLLTRKTSITVSKSLPMVSTTSSSWRRCIVVPDAVTAHADASRIRLGRMDLGNLVSVVCVNGSVITSMPVGSRSQGPSSPALGLPRQRRRRPVEGQRFARAAVGVVDPDQATSGSVVAANTSRDRSDAPSLSLRPATVRSSNVESARRQRPLEDVDHGGRSLCRWYRPAQQPIGRRREVVPDAVATQIDAVRIGSIA